MGEMQFQGCSIWTEGRMLQDDNGIYMGYTNSKIQFRVQGGQVSMTLRTDVTYMPDYKCLHIYVDDQLVEQVAFVNTQEEVCLEAFADDKVHVITLHKISEASTNRIGLMDVRIDNGRMIAWEPKARREQALILGDSISCGYGLYTGQLEDYEDGSKCYAHLAMQELGFGAEYVTASGYGMYQDYTGYTGHTIPKLYPYTNAFISQKLYDNVACREMGGESDAHFVPDWIVLNLGTNDSYNLHNEAAVENYINCYLEFVARLHQDYPNAVFLLLAGGMTADMYEITKDLTQTITKQMHCAAHYVEMPMQDARLDGVAKKDHPSEQTHRKFAKVLIDRIREIKGVTT